MCLICWAFPINTLANTAEEPKQKVEQVTSPTNVQSIQETKGEAVLRPLPSGAGSGHQPSLKPPVNDGHQNSKPFTGRNYSKEEVQQLIRDYSAQYGISAEIPLRIARCESGFNQFSKNKNSTASGVFQFLTSTWATKPLAKDHSVFDADANVHTAIWLMSLGKYSMWQCK